MFTGGAVLVLVAASFLGLTSPDRMPSELERKPESPVLLPSKEPDPLQPRRPPEAVPSSSAGEPAFRTVRLVLEPGDTLLEALDAAGVAAGEAYAATAALGDVVDPRRLRAGQSLTLEVHEAEDGTAALCLEELRLVPETDRMVVLSHLAPNRFRVREETIAHSRRLVALAGEITSSLYEAARAGGAPMPILMEAYKVLGYAVDFQRDLRAGDAFTLGYERFDDGKAGGLHPGGLVYASLSLGDRTLSVHRYTTEDGYTGFFDAEGRSIETSLMKTPVDGGRLSSLFGNRDHPVLGYTRMHKGLDFAAPRGTPVLAAGDGVVVRRSRYGSFGNYVRIKHDGTYSTAYAHLSRYAEGLEPGDRVRQGELIGYVGATGLATGPNLHYEVHWDGRQVDPMALDLPPRRVLRADELRRFERAKAALLARLRRDEAESRRQSTETNSSPADASPSL